MVQIKVVGMFMMYGTKFHLSNINAMVYEFHP
jgi:hypothetical protein